jgi:hypothetical protein
MEGKVGNMKRGITDFPKDLGLQDLDAGNVGWFSRSPKFKSVSPNRFEYSVVQ